MKTKSRVEKNLLIENQVNVSAFYSKNINRAKEIKNCILDKEIVLEYNSIKANRTNQIC